MRPASGWGRAVSDYLDQIGQRIEAATEGPWSVYRTRVGTYVTRPDLLGVAREWSLVWQDADAEFIANARVDVPRLLAAVRAVEAVHQKRGASWPHNGGVFVCGADGAIWPCPTIRALTNAVEGEQ